MADTEQRSPEGGNDSEPTAEEQAQMLLRKRIMQIMMDPTMSDAEKAQARQDLMSGKWSAKEEDKSANAAEGQKKKEAPKKAAAADKKPDLLEDTLKCVICCGLCERPVTGPCQHNFCLACFKRWLGQGKKTCPTCRAAFPAKFIENPRINTLLTYAIRCAKQGIRNDAPKTYNRIADESRPAEAFTTERAVRNGRANAASGRIMVNVPNDHFGPILPEHDPTNGKGVQVGDWWKDRLDCRQWGAHFPHVAGIAGQSNRGAQSVVLSGGYEDDHDEGEWFLYTGSGGRDLSGNKRTNKTQSFDQKFESMNQALRISCQRGLPVRVVRSFKEKRSSYAPSAETPVRFDGIYRILRCWRKKGAQGFLMCRYLFVRCDNAPAPWTSEEDGDLPRLEVPELAAKEIKEAEGQVFQMCDKPYWDYEESKGEWGWARDPPPSQKAPGGGDAVKKLKKKASAHERLLRDFSCSLCKGVLDAPLSMPCGHNFCKGCLDKRFAAAEAAQQPQGSKALAEAKPARTLRVRKVPKPCPTCKQDLADYLTQAAVNTEMAELIRRLQQAAEEARRQAEQEAADAAGDADGDDAGTSKAAEAAAAAPAGKDDGDDDNSNADGSAGEQEDSGDEEDGDGQGSEGEEQEEAGAADGPSQPQRPNKRQRVVPTAGNEAAGAGELTSARAAAAAASGPSQQQPAPAAAAAAAAAPASARYAAEVAQLTESFPEFDAGLIEGLLEDQGGDVDEVHAYLKRMKNQLVHSKRQASKAANGAAAGSNKGKGKGRGRKNKGDKATHNEPEQEEAVQDDDAAPDAVAGEAAAAAGAVTDDSGEDGAAAAAQADTEPETDAGRKQLDEPVNKAAAAAAAAATEAPDAAGEAVPAAAMGKKRRQAAAADGPKPSRRRTAK